MIDVKTQILRLKLEQLQAEIIMIITETAIHCIIK